MKLVKIYSTVYCGFCARAKELLKGKGVAFEEIDVTGDDGSRERLVELSGGLRTVPQIFIGELHVGGYTDLARLESDGKLDALLE